MNDRRQNHPSLFNPAPYYGNKRERIPQEIQVRNDYIDDHFEFTCTKFIKGLCAEFHENSNREGIADTPRRLAKAFREYLSGYGQDPKELFTTFDAENYDQLILLKDCECFSLCEHHLAPFFGKAHIAYIPDKRVVGVSKLARLLEIYSRRLQIQERMTCEIVDDLMKYLQPKGAACIIECQHSCIMCRGVKKQNAVMVTSALRGCFLDEGPARQELMQMIKD